MVNDPSQAIFCYPQQAGPSILTASSPPSPTPYNSLCVTDLSDADAVSNIRSLIHSPYQIAIARGLRGKEAEGLVDFIDQVSSHVVT